MTKHLPIHERVKRQIYNKKFEPDFAWNSRHHVSVSKTNSGVHRNLRDYFDRNRSHDYAQNEPIQPPRKHQIAEARAIHRLRVQNYSPRSGKKTDTSKQFNMCKSGMYVGESGGYKAKFPLKPKKLVPIAKTYKIPKKETLTKLSFPETPTVRKDQVPRAWRTTTTECRN